MFPLISFVSTGATMSIASVILSIKKAVADSQSMDLIWSQFSCRNKIRKYSYVSVVSHLLVTFVAGSATLVRWNWVMVAKWSDISVIMTFEIVCCLALTYTWSIIVWNLPEFVLVRIPVVACQSTALDQ